MMMYSGKSAPLRSACTNGGGESGLLAARYASPSPPTVGLKRHRGTTTTTTAENCDPNLSFYGENPLKSVAGIAPVERRTSSADGSAAAESPGAAVLCDAAAGESVGQAKDGTRPAKSAAPSSTKVSAGNGHLEHGHRHHVCRSPRCSSNNPDYATPPQTTPRKYLISKRHLLPGAICTRDPATLATRAQESPQTPSSSAGKPPKPVGRRLEASLQPQPSSESKPPPAPPPPLPCADGFPPTRIPRHPSARSPPVLPPASATPSHLASEAQQSSSAKEPARQRSPSEAPALAAAPIAGQAERLSRVESDASCTVVMAAASSVSSRASDAGASDDPLGRSDSELSTLEKLFLPPFADLRDSRSSTQSLADPEQHRVARDGAPLSSASSEQQQELSFPEVEQMAEKLAQNLAFEKADGEEAAEAESAAAEEDIPSASAGNENEAMRAVDGQTSDGFSTPKGSLRPEDKEAMRGEREECQAGEDRPGPFARAEESFSQKSSTGGGQLGESHERESCRECLARDTAEDLTEPEADQQENAARGRSIADFVANFERAQGPPQVPEARGDGPKSGGGRGGRPLWRSDCRDSRGLVCLKPARDDRRRAAEEWMVDSLLEGAISKLNGSGHGRVRVLVEAFESLMNLGGEAEERRRRASRVWCLNRMEKGEVDEDGEEFEDGEQRVDCYEVAGDRLQLRASMRLSLEGGGRPPLCAAADASEIEMSAIQKVQEWDDDRNQTATPPASLLDEREADGDDGRRDEEQLSNECAEESAVGGGRRRISAVRFVDPSELLGENERLSEAAADDERTVARLEFYTAGEATQRIEDLDQAYKYKASRRRRFWKSRSSKSEVPCASISSEISEKGQRMMRSTMLEPFHLLTEERGAVKENQFARKLGDLLAEEERLRNPVAQGLPWTTDEPQFIPKPPAKDRTRPIEFRHYSEWRAMERAEFDNYMAERCAYVQDRRQEQDRLRQMIEQDEVKRLRREMVPRAQLMPFFDQPFIPSRSSKRLTVPKEPAFHSRKHKRAKCMLWLGGNQEEQQQHQHQHEQ